MKHLWLFGFRPLRPVDIWPFRDLKIAVVGYMPLCIVIGLKDLSVFSIDVISSVKRNFTLTLKKKKYLLSRNRLVLIMVLDAGPVLLKAQGGGP